MKHILIIGNTGYIGNSLLNWLSSYSEQYYVQGVSARNNQWKSVDFSQYDVVVNCVGVAHINNITHDMKEMFFSINRDLAIEIGEYAKKYGVKQFVHFSSMNVYGDYCDDISDRNAVNPTSFYGNSKLEGDLGLEKIEDEKFIVAHVRPPFVYGKGCSGNYNTISKIAKKTPIFPDFENRKSMIYIDNLCEFVRLVIDNRTGGYLTPQNKELVSTADLVREIAEVSRKKILFTKIFNCVLPTGNALVHQIRRAFANDCYISELSDYFDWKYCVVDFKNSIRLTER